jgi:hypothetical protein
MYGASPAAANVCKWLLSFVPVDLLFSSTFVLATASYVPADESACVANKDVNHFQIHRIFISANLFFRRSHSWKTGRATQIARIRKNHPKPS